jgi:predicted dehydrogenase
LPVSVNDAVFMDPEQPSVGIVGLGGMGSSHADWIEQAGGQLVAGTDVVADARAAFADEFDVPTFAEHESMYDEVRPDAVVVSTPNRFHEPAATAALDRDIDVLCEKPLAHDLDAAERIADAATRSEGFCMVGFHNRFTPAATLFKRRQAAGAFGDLSHVEVNYVRRRGIPAPGSWFTDRSLSGGGALVDIGVHALDYALYLLEFPALVDVSASVRSQFGNRPDYADPDGWAGKWDGESDTFDVEDSVSAFLTFEDGSSLSLEVAWAANRSADRSVFVRGTEAGAETSVGGDELTILDTGTDGFDHYSDTTLRGEMDVTRHAAQDAAFVEAVRAGEPPDQNTVEEGVAVQRVIEAIYDAGSD